MDVTTGSYLLNTTLIPSVITTTVGPKLSFVAILTIMMVVGTMFGVTIAVIILISLWPRKKKRRTEEIPMQDLDSVYAELDNKSVSTEITRVTGDMSDCDFEASSISSVANGAAGGTMQSSIDRKAIASSKKVRFSEHQVEISGFDEPNGKPRSKLYIDVS